MLSSFILCFLCYNEKEFASPAINNVKTTITRVPGYLGEMEITMQFNSITFMIFFPIVLGVYFVAPKRLRTYWLLLASYAFYMRWNAKYALLIGGSTIITYVSGLLIQQFSGKRKNQKLTMIVCLVLNLFILAIFKYGNFGIETINSLFQLFRIPTISSRLNLLLPVGISFYTFQALGYIIDVYRGDVEAEKNFPRYALFVSFFPQLVAGPIERSKNLLTQMRTITEIKLWNADRITSGAILMVWGYFLKMVIADRAALLVDTVYNSYSSYGSIELILASIFFALQIYCDFSSYSLIAIGAAKIMGFSLMENFNAPYLSRSIKEFWSRWHISLSTWFRDYLYIPLGGNRKGKLRKAFHIIIVFLVSGLWHGANWSFVVWGGLHGLYQILGDLLKNTKASIAKKCSVRTDCFSHKLLQTIVTFTLVVFAWIFFRADSISDANQIILRIFTKQDLWVLFDGSLFTLGLPRPEMNILLVALGMLVLMDLLQYKKKIHIDEFLQSQNIWFEWLVIVLLIVIIFVFGEYGPGYDAKQFIYFQF